MNGNVYLAVHSYSPVILTVGFLGVFFSIAVVFYLWCFSFDWSAGDAGVRLQTDGFSEDYGGGDPAFISHCYLKNHFFI